MNGVSLRGRAVAFALCVGAGSFLLTFAAGLGGGDALANAANGVVVAVICAAMSWASADRALRLVERSVAAAMQRMGEAAKGDFETRTADDVRQWLPELAESMDSLFHETRSTFESIHNLAMFDPVTSLANRTNFRRDVERMMGDLGAETVSALLFIDLDNFKAVTDTLGHAQGDQLLAKVANRLRAVLHAEQAAGRRAGLIGRLAGDEFTMFLPEIGSEAEAQRVAQRAIYALGDEIDLSGHAVRVGASIGIALTPLHGGSLSLLMKAADVAMYHAKACGRGQAQLYTDALADALSEKLELERDLRLALAGGQFRLAFQPQIDLATGKPMSAEALLRWHHMGKVRTPGAFIDTAEESSLIVEIGDWVIDAVAQALARWELLGISQRLAINISAREIEQHNFFPRLRERLAAHGATPRLLELEISESLAMNCGDAVFRELSALRRDGAMVAIDDFGTGYSNFTRLRDLPIDRIKLDRSLVADVATCSRARAIVQATVGLVHGLGHAVIAAGVETEAQIEMLRLLGCDAIQGFAVAPPLDEAAFLDWGAETRLALAAA